MADYNTVSFLINTLSLWFCPRNGSPKTTRTKHWHHLWKVL